MEGAAFFLASSLFSLYCGGPRKATESSSQSSEDTLRRDLSTAHRACHEFGMDGEPPLYLQSKHATALTPGRAHAELVWNHISARFEDGWLITPGRMHWDEIKPADIIRASDNVTADIIHSSVYAVRPDVKAIVHLHTKYAVAVACLKQGFEALTQDGSFFYGKVREKGRGRCSLHS